MLCNQCGKEIMEGAKFCPFCGKNIEEESFNASKSKQSSRWTGAMILSLVCFLVISIAWVIIFMQKSSELKDAQSEFDNAYAQYQMLMDD